MGDPAEEVFEQQSPLGTAERYGWNRQPSFRFMERPIAHTPDYYCNSGFLVEVMGMTGDTMRALKVSKWEAIRDYWSKMQELYFLIWNSSRKTWYLVHYDKMKTAVARSRRDGGPAAFPNDGNEYWPIQRVWLEELAEETKTIG